MTKPRTPGPLGHIPDLPLPGNYPVLTMQLNTTLYSQIQQLKYVLILREPIAQIELGRVGGQAGLEPMILDIEQAVHAALHQAVYLSGIKMNTAP